jgi:hypothetical protein
MTLRRRPAPLFALAATAVFLPLTIEGQQAQPAPQQRMTFFITSAGPGNGADLGGLDGADKHCQGLAQTAGGGDLTWHAYLSVTAMGGKGAINARDRIGKGPWHNFAGTLIARTVAELHNSASNLTKETILTEKGAKVNGRGDTPNMHDILTGSRADGTAFSSAPGMPEMTCGEWTKSGDGSAMTGHHDRTGLAVEPWATSWNSSHNTVGCGQEALRRTGGNGLFYCFAAN